MDILQSENKNHAKGTIIPIIVYSNAQKGTDKGVSHKNVEIWNY